MRIAVIGFGEAGRTFTQSGRFAGRTLSYDTAMPAVNLPGITQAATNEAAVCQAGAVLSLVTADQALAAAQESAKHLSPGTLYLEMNSVAPNTKTAVAQTMAEAGGHCLDVAIMAPVTPANMDVPLLVSGDKAAQGHALLEDLGFTASRVVGDQIGQAAAIKMIRSVIVKGMEALTSEAVLAAHRADVLGEVLSSLGPEWMDSANYRLDRMLVHGTRRAAEMEEVAKTLVDLGIAPEMTRGTIIRQRQIGTLGFTNPPDTLNDKLGKLKDVP